jgi:cardiolipin synthase
MRSTSTRTGGRPAKFAEALAERCRARVQVQILLDGFGTLRIPAELRELLGTSGCQVAVFRPVTRWSLHRTNYRNHRRILIVMAGSASAEDRAPATSG